MTREEAIQHFKEQLDIFGGEHAEAIKVAIEALQNKSRPFGDCSKCIHTYGTLGCCTTVSNEWVYDCEHGMEQYKNTSVPSADRPKGKWIPLTERMPETDGEYLCLYGKHIHIGQMINGHFRHYGEVADHLIAAWMPLPEPYKESDNK